MKFIARRYRSQFVALAIAAVIGIVALSVDMTWVAGATEADTAMVTGAVELDEGVDVDSLYDAMVAEEETSREGLFAAPTSPQKEIVGHISWYGPGFHGRLTANGERFNMHGMTAAHKKLPFNTIVRVVDDVSGKAILVRINDRGPYVRGRVLDLSKQAATRLGMRGRGTTSGIIEVYPDFPVDDRITSHAKDGEESSPLRYQTYDVEARGVRPNGWSVSVASFSDFESAVNQYDKLRDEYDVVFLSRIREGKATSWRVTVGLYGSQYMAQNLLLELSDSFDGAAMITFENGYPVSLGSDGSETEA